MSLHIIIVILSPFTHVMHEPFLPPFLFFPDISSAEASYTIVPSYSYPHPYHIMYA